MKDWSRDDVKNIMVKVSRQINSPYRLNQGWSPINCLLNTSNMLQQNDITHNP
jgi:hypothetical protein